MAGIALDAFLLSIGAAVCNDRRGARASVTIEFEGWLSYRRFGRAEPRLVIRIGRPWIRTFLRPACRRIKVSCDAFGNGLPRLEIDGRLIELPDRGAAT
ncbi:hypothetical protein SAMN02800694_3453 [Luteibacter sp. UNCMF331Sha3.1]|uniref:hypothetical protein n=1 Tax=Luteibacter sp. UNCMF331Sha3.1 TaxID=1502760 RepID=UPI0008AE4658|nr:hypothetical protein [Luteibacter sp. UNCMF331Sha3.1]SEN42638.1 hypothetical protein SAMN02800694_3453 [Luteibacter sp. UNCMF331Sha3.1]